MGLIATARKGTRSPQEATERSGRGKARGKVRDAARAKRKRRKARCVIGPGTGTHQRPLDPAVARFAAKISKIFSGTTPDETNTTPETRQKDPTP